MTFKKKNTKLDNDRTWTASSVSFQMTVQHMQPELTGTLFRILYGFAGKS
jgi:hypothetical protein